MARNVFRRLHLSRGLLEGAERRHCLVVKGISRRYIVELGEKTARPRGRGIRFRA